MAFLLSRWGGQAFFSGIRVRTERGGGPKIGQLRGSLEKVRYY
jgi:hypothetical protein